MDNKNISNSPPLTTYTGNNANWNDNNSVNHETTEPIHVTVNTHPIPNPLNRPPVPMGPIPPRPPGAIPFSLQNRIKLIEIKPEDLNESTTGNFKVKYSNGDVYEGSFQKGVRQGKGTLKTNKSVYMGNFEGGKMSGQGTLHTVKCSMPEGEFKEQESYIGNFKDNKYDGEGILEVEGNKITRGTFEKGVIKTGVCNWYEDYYKGNRYVYITTISADQKLNGLGITIKENETITGLHLNGKPHGHCYVKTKDDPSFYFLIYDNGIVKNSELGLKKKLENNTNNLTLGHFDDKYHCTQGLKMKLSENNNSASFTHNLTPELKELKNESFADQLFYAMGVIETITKNTFGIVFSEREKDLISAANNFKTKVEEMDTKMKNEKIENEEKKRLEVEDKKKQDEANKKLDDEKKKQLDNWGKNINATIENIGDTAVDKRGSDKNKKFDAGNKNSNINQSFSSTNSNNQKSYDSDEFSEASISSMTTTTNLNAQMQPTAAPAFTTGISNSEKVRIINVLNNNTNVHENHTVRWDKKDLTVDEVRKFEDNSQFKYASISEDMVKEHMIDHGICFTDRIVNLGSEYATEIKSNSNSTNSNNYTNNAISSKSNIMSSLDPNVRITSYNIKAILEVTDPITNKVTFTEGKIEIGLGKNRKGNAKPAVIHRRFRREQPLKLKTQKKKPLINEQKFIEEAFQGQEHTQGDFNFHIRDNGVIEISYPGKNYKLLVLPESLNSMDALKEYKSKKA